MVQGQSSRVERDDMRARPRVVGILQARTTSSRLPGKVLADVAGRPLLGRVIDRARRAAALDDLWLATSSDPSDDPIAALAATEGVRIHRGALTDVLARYVGAAAAASAEIVVRLTGDNPLLEPRYIDAAVALHLESGADLTVARDPADVVPGTGCEVVSTEALRAADREGHTSEAREHVTWFLLATQPRFKLRSIVVPHGWRNPGIRLAVDEAADLDLVRTIYSRLEEQKPGFDLGDVLDLYRRDPGLFAVNRSVVAKPNLWARTLPAS